MQLTKKLLGFLNRVFNKSPLPYLAIQLQYAGGMSWQIADGMLTTTVTDGPGASLSVDLSQYTVGQLVDYLAAQPGYTVPYADHSTRAGLSALVLLDGSNDISLSNGDHLYAYANVLWSYMEANAAELQLVEAQIQNLPLEMATTTADSIWLDQLGAYYKVPRLQNEPDSTYAPRIIAQVLRPASNNVALEAAIQIYTGQGAKVTDVVLYGANPPLYNSNSKHDGSILYDAVNGPIYGLFDVTYGYDLINGGDLSSFQQIVVGLIETLRAAGTHMRSIALTGTILTDTLTPPTDDGPLAFHMGMACTDALTPPSDALAPMPVTVAPFADTFTKPTDAETIIITYNYQYNGVHSYNGVVPHMGGQVVTESL
ncbi:hypothetical protein [Paraburkholderia sp. MM6662-R1]|uniref:hypothetical protein n=1 Tax=Paraburkholderia sp. MM6662-R1 TaxID=2991066 RepID=UPI003D2392F7